MEGVKMQLKTQTERHVWKRMVALNARHPDGWTADDLYMAAVLHHDLPGTLSEGTVKRYLRKWWGAGLIGRKTFGRAALWRLATV